MGPTTLFDKSFLQSLSVDESVWFDHFFTSNICPLFFVETLADLEKKIRDGRYPEQEVQIIAKKFPEMHGTPNAHHSYLCLGNLLGNPVPMNGQIPIAGGREVKVNGKSGVVFENFPEADAFHRWQKQDFKEIERLYAKSWRESLKNIDLISIAEIFRNLGINGNICHTLDDAKRLAQNVVMGKDKPFERMRLAIMFFNISEKYHPLILRRWNNYNYPPLSEYAPYTAYVLTIEIFFQIAISAKLIATERPSNRIDIAYLFYLPFSNCFVSSDKLHRRCASLFLRSDQNFIWGHDLKNDLSKLNEYYLSLSDIEKEKGITFFAGYPPKDGEFLVSKIWDQNFSGWRNKKDVDLSENKKAHKMIIDEAKKFIKAPALEKHEIDFDPRNPDTMSIERSIHTRKGSWFQMPKYLEDKLAD